MTDIITMPETLYVFSATRFILVTVNTTAAASTFNPSSRVDGPSSRLWQADLTFRPRKADDLDELERFIMKLDGGRVLARLYDRKRTAATGMTQPRGSGGSGPTVNLHADVESGAEQITLRNLIPSQSVSLKSMDHLQHGENLHAVVDSGPSDANGRGTFTIRPPFRMGGAEGDPITLVKPTGLFRLTAGGGDLVVHGQAFISQELTLSFIEEPEFVA